MKASGMTQSILNVWSKKAILKAPWELFCISDPMYKVVILQDNLIILGTSE
uniref:Uncharacterized protein n=1 Tax=Rhizophora mucronata TaxID=61149 RepID=A0A2P2IYL0_RHIMU